MSGPDPTEAFWADIPHDPIWTGWRHRGPADPGRDAWSVIALVVTAALLAALVSVLIVKSIDTDPAPPPAPAVATSLPVSPGELWYDRHLLLIGDLEATASTAANAAAVNDIAGTSDRCAALAPLADRAAGIEPVPSPAVADDWARAVAGFQKGAELCERGLTVDSSQFRAGALSLVSALAALDTVSQALQ